MPLAGINKTETKQWTKTHLLQQSRLPWQLYPMPSKSARNFSLPGIVFRLAAGRTLPVIYAGLSDFSIQKVDVSAEKIEPAAWGNGTHGSYVMGLVDCGETLISGGYDCSLIWWNMQSGEIIRTVADAHGRWIRMLAASPDQTRVVSVADDMQTKLWDAATGECLAAWGDYELKTPHGFPSMLYAVTFSLDGKWIATGDRTGRVLIRESATGRIATTLETPVLYTWDPTARRHSIGGIRSLAFSNDSQQLAVGGMGKSRKHRPPRRRIPDRSLQLADEGTPLGNRGWQAQRTGGESSVWSGRCVSDRRWR